MNPIEVCQYELEKALDTIQTMTDQQEEAISRLDMLIDVLKAMETGDLSEALEIISDACFQFGLSCL